GFVHGVYGSLEGKADFLAGFEHIKPIGIDSDHRRGYAGTVSLQRAGVIVVHMFEDLQFLNRRKRILRCEFGGIDPENLSEATNESDSDKLQSEECEIVRPFVLA